MGVGGATDCGGDWSAVAWSSEPCICILMSPSVWPPGTLRARAPAPKNGVAKPGPRAETPQPTTARTRTLARKRGSPIRRLLMTRRLSGGIRAAPTSAGMGGRNESRGLRAATGWVATARNPRLARKQPPATFDSASPAARRPERCKDVAGPRHMAREGECGTSRTESEERRSMRLIPDIVLKGLVFRSM